MKIILKLAASIILSAISAYITYLLLWAFNIVHYYELAEPNENIESDLTLLISFILFNILYIFLFFHKNRKITVDKDNNK